MKPVGKRDLRRSQYLGAHFYGTDIVEISTVGVKNTEISHISGKKNMCLMGVVQKLFLACENRLPMKYIIPENIFDMTDIWLSGDINLQVRFYTYSRGGVMKYIKHEMKIDIADIRSSAHAQSYCRFSQ